MSGPKYYNFYFNSAEEAGEVFSQLTSFPQGVRIRVENNKLNFTVSQSLWYKGVNRDFIKHTLEKAKEQYYKLIKLVEQGKKTAKQKLTQKRSDLQEKYNSAKSKFAKTRAIVQQLKAQVKTKYTTAFGTFDFEAQSAEVMRIDTQLNDYLQKIDKAYQQSRQQCDIISSEIDKCKDVTSIDKLLAQLSILHLPELNVDDKLQDLSVTIQQRSQKLAKAKQFLDNLYQTICQKGLQDCVELVKAKLATLDITQQSSCQTLYQYVEQLFQERLAQTAQFAINSNDSVVADSVKQQMSALAQLIDELQAIESTNLYSHTVEDYTASNSQLLSQCRQQLDKVEQLQFVSRENKSKLNQLSNQLESYKHSLQSSFTNNKLKELSKELNNLVSQCVISNDQYVRFSQEQRKYIELYMRLQGVLSAEGSTQEQCEDMLPSPDSVMLAYGDVEKQIAKLQERNQQLSDMLNKVFKESFCQAVSAVVENSDNCKVFKKENTADDVTHYSYVRQENKGVMFDVQCSNDGKVAVFPKGVMLCNGVTMITPEQLQQTYKNCNWAEQITQTFEQMGIKGLRFEEMSQDVAQSMCNTDNYYYIPTEEESIRYLTLIGTSQAEINRIMNIADNSDKVRRRADSNTNTKVIK